MIVYWFRAANVAKSGTIKAGFAYFEFMAFHFSKEFIWIANKFHDVRCV